MTLEDNIKKIQNNIEQLGDSPFYDNADMYKCPIYHGIFQSELKDEKTLLPFGMCGYDKSVNDCRKKLFEDCEKYLKYMREINNDKK